MRFKYKKMIVTASGSIMLFGMALFSTRNSMNTNAADKPVIASNEAVTATAAAIADNTSAAVSGEAVSPDAIDSGTSDNAKGVSILMKNAYPEVNKLIDDYLKARLTVDKDKIGQLVDNINYVGLDDLPKIVKNMESIKLTDCYTIDGPEEKAMMVYARNEIKFKGIDTAASSLDGFYIRPDENGDLKIVLSPLPNEVQKIIDEDIKREDVSALLSDVNTKLAHEIKTDRKLADFFDKLKNRQPESDESIEIPAEKDKESDTKNKDGKADKSKSEKSSSGKKKKADNNRNDN